MDEHRGGESETVSAGSLASPAFSERDLAHGVTRWMNSNFRPQLADAVRSTPFTVPLLCAIACREAGMYWLPLTPHKSAAEILSLCVYDASGDVAGAPRGAFPINTAQFRLAYGDAFTIMLTDEANKARAARGLNPASIVYKGYGIFQRDLQYVRTDEVFFRSKQWYSFTECVSRAVKELKTKFEATGDIQDAVRAYNGSGAKAEQYARDVMRLLPFCEEAAASTPGPSSAVSQSRAATGVTAFVESGRASAGDDDPAFPADGEISDTADFDTARLLANVGMPNPADRPPLAGATFTAGAALGLDLAHAKAFLDACRTSKPRVTYGLGKKVPFLGAVPGRDFTQVDCSGFVREAVRLSTNPPAPFPDGSVIQHDWVRAHGFETSTIAAGMEKDGAVRMAFLRPQDSPFHIGHVVLISGGMTLESHGGVGPDSRAWNGEAWQSKTSVYVLARDAQLSLRQGGATFQTTQPLPATLTVRRGLRYRATILLTGFEQFASDDLIADKLRQVGFANVVVSGSGGTRRAEGTWTGADTTAQLDPRLSNVIELPAPSPAVGQIAARESIYALASERRLVPGHVMELSRRRGVSPAMLRAMPDPIVRRTLGRLQYADLPRVREGFRHDQARDDAGNIHPQGLQRALSQQREFAGPASRRIAGVPTGPRVAPFAPPPTAGLNPAHTGWTSLGPGNIGGRIRSIVVDPRNSSRLWAGSVGGGVWQTQDGGQTWQAVDDLLANLAATCMAIDRSHPDTIYAGTGEGFFNVDAIRGAGIFWTTDATTWTQITQTNTTDFQAVNRISVSADGQIVLAATESGVFRSGDPERARWTRTLPEEMAMVVCHPLDSVQAVAAGLRNGRAYYSNDGGQTWSVAQGGTWSGRVELAYAAHDPSTVYASVDVNGGEIWRSPDGGKTFTRRNSAGVDQNPTNYLGNQGWYGNSIWAGDPTDTNLLLVGGVNLWRSTDGGNTLIDISTWWDPRSCHADHHCIMADPKYDGVGNKTVFFGNDGGIYKAQDARSVGNDPQPPRIAGWITLDNSFGVTQFYSGAGNAATGMIIGGAQDNGTLTYTPQTGSQKWGTMFGGDGGFCAADPTDSNVCYGEYVYLNIHRSVDGGGSADYISGQFWDGQQWTFKPVPYQIPDAASQDALFIAPFVLDPNNANRILAGGLSLWRTEDAKTPNTNTSGPSWVSIKNSSGGHISAIAVTPGNADVVWVGHEDGQLYKTANGTSAAPLWQQMDNTGANPLNPARYCTRIAIDPRATNTIYVMFGGYVPDNLWKTVDGGASWASIGAASLPNSPFRALALHPDNPRFLYLGTEVGLFASEDAGTTWSSTNEGPTNCSVDDLFWMNKTLVAVTHGRGMFAIDLSTI